MIVGVGLDIVDIGAFEAQLEDSASTFVDGTFTGDERRTASARPSGRPGLHLAARFAAKEAFIKAWSSANRGKTPMLASPDLREIEVINDNFGRPALTLHGLVAEAFSKMGDTVAHLSLSHDGNVAAAVVVLENHHEATES